MAAIFTEERAVLLVDMPVCGEVCPRVDLFEARIRDEIHAGGRLRKGRGRDQRDDKGDALLHDNAPWICGPDVFFS